jgi:DNA invertase Pin-like site-specific DNA recombinase
VPGLLIGYARVSTDAQDLTAQRDGLPGLGVELDRVYVDQGLTGYTARSPTRSSPGCPAGQMRRVTSAP